ncbi:MAG: NAD-dependent epimerase/dehydratase family protein [Nitrospirae bacterium]|nr:MAG: NAD-dependent epimerase/dehydratase family protein [Nitrospirota bacterium]
MLLDGKCVLITGGTGSLGKALTKRILTKELGTPRKIIIFSRDEAKQHAMRMEYQHRRVATDEVIYHNFEEMLEFRIGDVRDYHSVASAVQGADVIFNAAALKQVPSCEYFPYEAVRTNVEGPENIVRVIRELKVPVETVVGVSTDKACKPVNVMGMTKAIQERIFLSANITCPNTRFVCVRYGNVLASRGSVIPLFHDQIRHGGPVTITTEEMTRFLLSLDDAVDVIFGALSAARRGETFIPKAPAARVLDIARALIGHRPIEVKMVGIRPGEKIHEILISEEECHRSADRGQFYSIRPILPELDVEADMKPAFQGEYSSALNLLSPQETQELLSRHALLVTDRQNGEEELLR